MRRIEKLGKDKPVGVGTRSRQGTLQWNEGLRQFPGRLYTNSFQTRESPGTPTSHPSGSLRGVKSRGTLESNILGDGRPAVGMGVPPVLNRQAGCLSHRESSTGRDAGAYDLVAAGVPARHFLDPGSQSGVTDDGNFALRAGRSHRQDRSEPEHHHDYYL